MSNELADKREALAQTLLPMVERLSAAMVGNPDVAATHARAEEMLELATKPVRIALGGEFSAGKSTLTKMLLGHHVVKMQASASAMPTVCFKYGKESGYVVITGETARDIASPDDLTEEEMRAADSLDVYLDVEFLKRFEIYDTPGTSDPTRVVDQLLKVSEQVDLVIWCTNATQAWRESERRMWAEIPDAVKPQSLLAVTHVDLPNVKASLDRLMGRLNREAAPLFGQVIPMDLRSAANARDDAGEVVDAASWTESGGTTCLEALEATAAQINSEAISVIEAAIETEISSVVQNLPVAKPKLSLVSSQELKPEETFRNFWVRRVNDVLENDAEELSSKEYIDLLEECTGFAIKQTKESIENIDMIAMRLTEAIDYMSDSSHAGGDIDELYEPKAVIKQIDWEFRHMVLQG